MDNRKFTPSAGTILRNSFIRALVISFVAALVLVGAFSDAAGIFAIFWLAFIGSCVWGFTHMTTVDVGNDGVRITQPGGKSEFYKYEKWYFSTTGKQTLKAEMRKLDRTDDFDLKAFSAASFKDMTTLIKKRQEVWFLKRNANEAQTAGTQTTIDDMKKTQYDFAKRAMAAAASSAEAAARNPYAKRQEAAKVSSQNVEKKIATDTPAAKPIIDTTPLVSEKITETPKITDLPVISDLPDTSNFDEFLSEKPKESAHDHGEDFHKLVFYYPRRDIEDRVERSSTLAILSTLLVSVAVFLIAYILAPRFVIFEAVLIGVICVFIIAATVGGKKAKLHGMPSKLEVTKNHLVLDNTRYRVGEMSQKMMTSPDTKTGNRALRFVYAGKNVVCPLGPCTKPVKNSDEYFGRYSELCAALSEKGFKCS